MALQQERRRPALASQPRHQARPLRILRNDLDIAAAFLEQLLGPLDARALPARRVRHVEADQPLQQLGWPLMDRDLAHRGIGCSPHSGTAFVGFHRTDYGSTGERDLRGPLAKQGPRYLRWALVEAATHACTHPTYRQRYQQTKARIGKQRGAKVAQVDLARRLAEAIWHMLTRDQPFAPKGATDPLAA
jgi:Transposase IS116/IS110/IS902 family